MDEDDQTFSKESKNLVWFKELHITIFNAEKLKQYYNQLNDIS